MGAVSVEVDVKVLLDYLDILAREAHWLLWKLYAVLGLKLRLMLGLLTHEVVMYWTCREWILLIRQVLYLDLILIVRIHDLSIS